MLWSLMSGDCVDLYLLSVCAPLDRVLTDVIHTLVVMYFRSCIFLKPTCFCSDKGGWYMCLFLVYRMPLMVSLTGGLFCFKVSTVIWYRSCVLIVLVYANGMYCCMLIHKESH